MCTSCETHAHVEYSQTGSPISLSLAFSSASSVGTTMALACWVGGKGGGGGGGGGGERGGGMDNKGQ